MDGYITIGKDGAAEGVAAKALEVVGQQISGIHIDVVGEIGEVIVMDASREQSLIAIGVIDETVLEGNLIVSKLKRVVAQLIGAVEGADMSLAINHQFAIEIDGAQGASQLHRTKAITIELVDERRGERTGEIKACTIGKDVEIDVFTLGRYIAVDKGFGVRTIVGNRLNVNLFFLFVPVYLRIEFAHATILKLEAFYLQFGIGLQLSHNASQHTAASGLSAEADSIEIYQIQHVIYIDVAHIHLDRVATAF